MGVGFFCVAAIFFANTSGPKPQEVRVISGIKVERDAFASGTALIRVRHSDEALRVMTRVFARYCLTDYEGNEHTYAERQENFDIFPSYVQPVVTYGDDLYYLYVDAAISPELQETLIRILIEEIVAADLPVEEIFLPTVQRNFGQLRRETVGPGGPELFGDVPYSGYIPRDITERTSVPERP
jgi:hypothetical protein